MALLTWLLADLLVFVLCDPEFVHSSRDTFYSNDLIKQNAAEYHEYLANCEWTESLASASLKGFFYARTADQYGFYDATPSNASHTVRVRECIIHDKVDKDSVWTIQRVGPFESVGGDMTHFVSWEDPGHVGKRLEAEGRLCLNAYVARAIDEAGTPIGYPPIHMHHAHLNPDGNPYLWAFSFNIKQVVRAALAISYMNPWRALSAIDEGGRVLADKRIDQMHGDMQCPDDTGGMNCTIHRLPSPYGTCFTRSFFTDAMLQDTRAPDSPVLSLWYETALRVSKNASVSVSPLVRYTNAPAEACRDKFGFLPDPFVTYRVPMDKFSYMAHSIALEGSARDLLVVSNHLHRKVILEHWVIIGEGVTLQALGLHYMKRPEGLNVASHPRPGSPTPQDITQSMMNGVESLRAKGLVVHLCIDNGPHVLRVNTSESQSKLGWLDGEYDRYSGLRCDSARIRVPLTTSTPVLVTQVAFHRPSPDFKEWFPMHAAIFVQGSPGEDVPSERPQWIVDAAALTYDEVTMAAIKGFICLCLMSVGLSACCFTACFRLCARRTKTPLYNTVSTI
mmetsp:Transcript_80929/g.229175  ORF Transcript_80929/g.229175 Transcript_80929/m.229175 type:complete len:563 (+) Transcript_80929:122-1810(+)